MFKVIVTALLLTASASYAGERAYIEMRELTKDDMDLLLTQFVDDHVDAHMKLLVPLVQSSNPFDEKRIQKEGIKELRQRSNEKFGQHELGDIIFVFRDFRTFISDYSFQFKQYGLCVPTIWGMGNVYGHVQGVFPNKYNFTRTARCAPELQSRNIGLPHDIGLQMESDEQAEQLFYVLQQASGITVSTWCAAQSMTNARFNCYVYYAEFKLDGRIFAKITNDSGVYTFEYTF